MEQESDRGEVFAGALAKELASLLRRDERNAIHAHSTMNHLAEYLRDNAKAYLEQVYLFKPYDLVVWKTQALASMSRPFSNEPAVVIEVRDKQSGLQGTDERDDSTNSTFGEVLDLRIAFLHPNGGLTFAWVDSRRFRKIDEEKDRGLLNTSTREIIT